MKDEFRRQQWKCIRLPRVGLWCPSHGFAVSDGSCAGPKAPKKCVPPEASLLNDQSVSDAEMENLPCYVEICDAMLFIATYAVPRLRPSSQWHSIWIAGNIGGKKSTSYGYLSRVSFPPRSGPLGRA